MELYLNSATVASALPFRILCYDHKQLKNSEGVQNNRLWDLPATDFGLNCYLKTVPRNKISAGLNTFVLFTARLARLTGSWSPRKLAPRVLSPARLRNGIGILLKLSVHYTPPPVRDSLRWPSRALASFPPPPPLPHKLGPERPTSVAS